MHAQVSTGLGSQVLASVGQGVWGLCGWTLTGGDSTSQVRGCADKGSCSWGQGLGVVLRADCPRGVISEPVGRATGGRTVAEVVADPGPTRLYHWYLAKAHRNMRTPGEGAVS